jgi:hypothetical protein
MFDSEKRELQNIITAARAQITTHDQFWGLITRVSTISLMYFSQIPVNEEEVLKELFSGWDDSIKQHAMLQLNQLNLNGELLKIAETVHFDVSHLNQTAVSHPEILRQTYQLINDGFLGKMPAIAKELCGNRLIIEDTIIQSTTFDDPEQILGNGHGNSWVTVTIKFAKIVVPIVIIYSIKILASR